MKKLVCVLIALIVLAQLFVFAEEPDYDKFRGQGITLEVYNWGEYISDGAEDSFDTIGEFELRTGIKVNYTTFASNEELYAKIKSGGAQYDVIIPSDYMISRMISENMLEPLNFDNIPNFENIMERFKNPEYDAQNLYSVPYTWGTVGIVYNTTMVEDVPDTWDALWDERYMGNMLMFSNSRDAFGISLLRLGYSLNTTDEDEIREAAQELKKQKMLVQAYVMDEIYDKMGGGEAALAPYYAGDSIVMMDENPDLAFVIPKEGTNLFTDAMCIPAGAKNKEAAELFINYMCETDVGVANAEYIGYSTPNSLVYDALSDETRDNETIYPTEDTLNKCEVFRALPDETNSLMDSMWTEILSYNESGNPWAGPVFIFLTFGASIAIIVYKAVKRKRENY